VKLYTPDNTELIEINAVAPAADGLLIEGTIMGAMPMKAVLRPEELRRAFRLLTIRSATELILMLFRRSRYFPRSVR
jgi:hypothetical protein